MKRWMLFQIETREEPDGEWVRFEDARTEIAKWEDAADKLQGHLSKAASRIQSQRDELTAVTLERDALKRELMIRKRCTFGGDYGVCELEAGHDGKHSLRSPSKSSVEGQS